jgi:hypothetical protein
MIALELWQELVAQAALAPSTHNTQPARWRLGEGRIDLLEDRSRRLPAGDPTGRDMAMSLGAATEGMALALSANGLRLEDLGPAESDETGQYVPVRSFALHEGAEPDPLLPFVAARRSHRGRFAPITEADRAAALGLAGEDTAVIADPDAIRQIARLADRTGHGFFRDTAFRAELRTWMRLSRRDPRWAVDGLNAEAMAMSSIEAKGAGLVLGPLFRLLDAIGLAAPLTAEAGTIRSAAATLLFHRPADEPRFESGRAFCRFWLRVTRAGLHGAVMASLADDPESARALAGMADLPGGRTLVSTLRVGRAPDGSDYPRARIAVPDLIV